MRRSSIALLAIIPFVVSGVVCAQAPKDATVRSIAEDAIREAVLRVQMDHWLRPRDNGQADNDQIDEHDFCEFHISVEDKDPSETLLKRFGDIPRIVKSQSGAMVAATDGKPTCPKPTSPYQYAVRNRDITFYVEKIRWQNKTTVRLDGGYKCGLLCASGVTYRLKLKAGKWVVVKERANWFS